MCPGTGCGKRRIQNGESRGKSLLSAISYRGFQKAELCLLSEWEKRKIPGWKPFPLVPWGEFGEFRVHWLAVFLRFTSAGWLWLEGPVCALGHGPRVPAGRGQGRDAPISMARQHLPGPPVLSSAAAPELDPPCPPPDLFPKPLAPRCPGAPARLRFSNSGPWKCLPTLGIGCEMGPPRSDPATWTPLCFSVRPRRGRLLSNFCGTTCERAHYVKHTFFSLPAKTPRSVLAAARLCGNINYGGSPVFISSYITAPWRGSKGCWNTNLLHLIPAEPGCGCSPSQFSEPSLQSSCTYIWSKAPNPQVQRINIEM